MFNTVFTHKPYSGSLNEEDTASKQETLEQRRLVAQRKRRQAMLETKIAEFMHSHS